MLLYRSYGKFVADSSIPNVQWHQQNRGLSSFEISLNFLYSKQGLIITWEIYQNMVPRLPVFIPTIYYNYQIVISLPPSMAPFAGLKLGWNWLVVWERNTVRLVWWTVNYEGEQPVGLELLDQRTAPIFLTDPNPKYFLLNYPPLSFWNNNHKKQIPGLGITVSVIF